MPPGVSEISAEVAEVRNEPFVTELDGTSAQESHELDPSQFFNPLSPDEFLATFYAEKKAALFRGLDNRFESLINWTQLNDLIASRALVPQMVSLARDGTIVPVQVVLDTRRGMGLRPSGDHPPVVDHRLLSLLRQGATLILNRVHLAHAPIQGLVNHIEDLTEGFGQANVYASWTNTRGFSTHWDTHDAFVFQITGSKRWFVYGETRPFPLDSDVAPNPAPTGEPLWDGLLTAGDLLYLPRGVWHDARVENPEGEGIGSMHLTLSTIPVTGQNVLRWLNAKLSQHELFRMDLPVRADRERRRAHFKAIRELLLKTLEEKDEDDFWSDSIECWSESAATTLDASLEPWKLGEVYWNDCTINIRGRRFAEVRTPEEDGDDFLLIANGHTWTFDRHCLDLTKFLLANANTSVKDLKRVFHGRFSPEFIDGFLPILIEQGTATVGIPQSIRDLS